MADYKKLRGEANVDTFLVNAFSSLWQTAHFSKATT
jgi:hypothetical protein